MDYQLFGPGWVTSSTLRTVFFFFNVVSCTNVQVHNFSTTRIFLCLKLHHKFLFTAKMLPNAATHPSTRETGPLRAHYSVPTNTLPHLGYMICMICMIGMICMICTVHDLDLPGRAYIFLIRIYDLYDRYDLYDLGMVYLMLPPAWEPCVLRDLPQDSFPGLDLYCTDPVQHLIITAG